MHIALENHQNFSNFIKGSLWKWLATFFCSGLEELAQDIDTGADCGWQLRLYSYENKTAGSDVYKVSEYLLPMFFGQLLKLHEYK